MTLLSIEHPRRLTSPAEAEAWFRAIGEKRVSARGFHTVAPEQIDLLVAAIEPKRDHTISFEGGSLGTDALAALDTLSTERFGYLDVRTAEANLRIWPQRHSWVHVSGPLSAASRALGVPLEAGIHMVGDTQVEIVETGDGFYMTVETKTASAAITVFRAVAGAAVDRGFINGVHNSARSDRALRRKHAGLAGVPNACRLPRGPNPWVSHPAKCRTACEGQMDGAGGQGPEAGRTRVRPWVRACTLRGTMIHSYNNQTHTRWDRGEFKVQLVQPNNPKPLGFCDGTGADEAELQAIAESEGAEEFVLHKKVLKTGREIWTLGGPG